MVLYVSILRHVECINNVMLPKLNRVWHTDRVVVSITLTSYIIQKTKGNKSVLRSKKEDVLFESTFVFCPWKRAEIFPHVDPQTDRASFFVSCRHTSTLLNMIWFTARVEDLHLSRCVHPSMLALRKIKTTDLYCTVHTDTGMHYIKPKNPSFPSAFSFLLQNTPFPPPSSPISFVKG